MGFESPELNASPCEFRIKIPIPTFSLQIPAIQLPSLPIPVFSLSLAISCSLDNPIDLSGGLEWGGGRKPKFDPDPDLTEEDGGVGNSIEIGGGSLEVGGF